MTTWLSSEISNLLIFLTHLSHEAGASNKSTFSGCLLKILSIIRHVLFGKFHTINRCKAQAAQQVAGYDLGKGASDRARKMGAIDQQDSTLADAVRGAELIMLATPVGTMRSLVPNIARMASPGAVVTDMARMTVQVMHGAQAFLPAVVAFVGGHPKIGKQGCGGKSADAALFQERMDGRTPTGHPASAALKRGAMLSEALRARGRCWDPAEHDQKKENPLCILQQSR